jgi:NAD(P)-dependent dehydrogenase (short-subunit alcohol dehydrogenase family)
MRAAGGSGEFLQLDLADPASVREAADSFLATDRPLHVLICNAGIGGTKGITEEGFEVTFAVNHLGHHLLTRRLTDRLVESAPARVLVLASAEHHNVEHIDWERLRRRTRSLFGRSEYQVSKLANVLFGRQLARRLDGTGVDVFIVHPGLVASEIWRDLPLPMRLIFRRLGAPPEEGARTSVWCATAPGLTGTSGRYYGDRKEKRTSPLARDDALAAELWRRSEEWLAPWLPG